MLITMTARLVRPHGRDEEALPGEGRIEYRPATHGVWEGALRGQETVEARIVDGVAELVELTPGTWRVRVIPKHGVAWDSFMVDLEPGMTEPVDLATLAPVLVVDGEKWTAGPAGASVVGAVDNGDQTVSFTLSNGTVTDPVTIPPGPAGVGVASISDPDTDSLVTITYTDGTTSIVQAIVGAPGDEGHTPTITWAGTALVIDGETGPDLKGDQGDASTVPGPANVLTVGTVTTGAPDTPASAVIRGEAPEQTLDLTLPRGLQGIPGEATLPDTGWRILPTTALVTAGEVHARRIGPTVYWRFVELAVSGAGAIIEGLGPFAFAAGASNSGVVPIPVWRLGQGGSPSWITAEGNPWGGRLFANGAIAARTHGEGSHLSSLPFPTGTLPGDAA